MRAAAVMRAADMHPGAGCMRHSPTRNGKHARLAANSWQGFGVTARSTLDTRKLDPSGILVFHQADVGEFLRDEDTMF